MLSRKAKTVLERLGGPPANSGDWYLTTGKAIYQNKRFILLGRRRAWWVAVRFNFRFGFDFCRGDFDTDPHTGADADILTGGTID